MNQDKSYRQSYVIRRIQTDKEEISKKVMYLAASAIAVGLGGLGVHYFGKDIAEIFKSDVPLTMKSYIEMKFKGSLISFPIIAVLGGIYFGINSFKNLFSAAKDLMRQKSELKKLEESDEFEGRSR